jgi:hypothetical protein
MVVINRNPQEQLLCQCGGKTSFKCGGTRLRAESEGSENQERTRVKLSCLPSWSASPLHTCSAEPCEYPCPAALTASTARYGHRRTRRGNATCTYVPWSFRVY